MCAGAACGDVASWVRGLTPAGNDRLQGQIFVRPPVGSGAVRAAAVRLVPVVPTGSVTRVLFLLGAPSPRVVAPAVDHAGRWSSRLPVPGWGYAVVVEAEGCAPRLAGVVEAFWLLSVRVDHLTASCRVEGLSQWTARVRSAPSVRG